MQECIIDYVLRCMKLELCVSDLAKRHGITSFGELIRDIVGVVQV
jgi:hypothetical protein